MGRHTLKGNPPIEVVLRRSVRAKRLSLRVSRLDGRVTLTLPRFAPEREGIAFLRAKEPWLRGHLADMRPAMVAQVGQSVPVRGVAMPIVVSAAKRARILEDRIEVTTSASAAAQTKALLRHAARDALAQASDRYAQQVGKPYTRLSIRDTRSRWGSCSSTGALMYSWRLIMAPPAVLDYVAAHEVAHLVEMNHRPAFWSVVAQLCPDYDRHRQWLREEGDKLHRIVFDD
ncbi:SprT family zinc-dependent metalloprotease [Yoonia sp.]|uniref:M48 family metallopeptidase n=1 Tax=Yoonia sp. TaxID=2212373 RepID=UPI002DFD63A6|nr:SprT family zinc-dependent metalloprotease [Yoonia sp.]